MCYLGEAPIYVAIAWRCLEDGRGQRRNWWRLEIKSDVKYKYIKAKHNLIVAEHPYGNGWTSQAPFKVGSKKGALERMDIPNEYFDSIDVLSSYIENMNNDYWETGNYLTAAISQPDLPFDPAMRNVQQSGLFIFGLCENAKDAEELLIRDSRVRELIGATERGTIRFWSPDAQLASSPELLDEVKDEGWSLMLLSIREALAGPHCDSDQWIGRPVTEKVDQIYRGHLNRRNRKLTEERQRLSPLDEGGVSDGATRGESEEAFE
jgi:hypothetical protein